MNRARLAAMVVAVAFLAWPTGGMAQEQGEGDKAKARERRAARAREARRGQQSPEEMAKRTERMKKALEQRITYMTKTAESLQARREELDALAAKATIPVSPPSSQLFTVQGARGGRALAMRMAYRRRGRPAARPGAASPTTFEVASTEELKKALKGAGDAYAVLLPLLEQQRKATQTQIDQLAAAERPDPTKARAEMAASRELMKKVYDVQATVGDAEADLELLLAKAWLEAATAKATSEEAKEAAAAAQAALVQYLVLKPQLAELEQKIGQELSAAQEGFRKVLTELYRQRAGRRRGAPRDDAARPRGKARRRPTREGAPPRVPEF